jgi:hypothetical protein
MTPSNFPLFLFSPLRHRRVALGLLLRCGLDPIQEESSEMSGLRVAVCAVVVAFVFGWAASAQQQEDQQDTAVISGAISDSSGAPVAGASVALTDDRGGNESTNADDKGRYKVEGLAAGSYTITISADGFKVFEWDALKLIDGAKAVVNAQLQREDPQEDPGPPDDAPNDSSQ